MTSILIENIEIIGQGRERNQSAHRKLRDIYKETKVADVRDESIVNGRMAARKLALKKGEQFHILAGSLGVRGIAFSQRNMISGVIEGRM